MSEKLYDKIRPMLADWLAKNTAEEFKKKNFYFADGEPEIGDRCVIFDGKMTLYGFRSSQNYYQSGNLTIPVECVVAVMRLLERPVPEDAKTDVSDDVQPLNARQMTLLDCVTACKADGIGEMRGATKMYDHLKATGMLCGRKSKLPPFEEVWTNAKMPVALRTYEDACRLFYRELRTMVEPPEGV